MTILNLESCPLCLTSHVVSRGYPIMYKVVCDCGYADKRLCGSWTVHGAIMAWNRVANMTAVLLSVKPCWNELIELGEKTIEIRKKKPRLNRDFIAYIYESVGKGSGKRGRGMVTGAFICRQIEEYRFDGDKYVHNDGSEISGEELDQMRLDQKQLYEYGKGVQLYGLRIDNYSRYKEPMYLSDYKLKRPPLSWCFVGGK